MAFLHRWIVGDKKFTTCAAHVGVKHGGEERQRVLTTAPVFVLIFIDVPVEVIVGVAPPFNASRVGAPRGEERAQKFAEIVLHHGLLLRRVGGSGGAVVGSPAEQLVFELVLPQCSMSVT